MVPVSPPTSPRASAAWQRTVSSASFNKPISPGATAAAARPDPAQRPGGLGPHRRRFVGQGRLAASPRPARPGRRAGAGAARFLPPEEPPRFHASSSHGHGEAARPCVASDGPRAAEDPQRFDHALPHHLAGVLGECGHRGDRFQGVELARARRRRWPARARAGRADGRTRAGMIEGPIVSRISGSWSRCSLVSDGTERSDTSSGPMARAP